MSDAARFVDKDAQQLVVPRAFQFHLDDFETRGGGYGDHLGNLLDARNGVVPSHVFRKTNKKVGFRPLQ